MLASSTGAFSVGAATVTELEEPLTQSSVAHALSEETESLREESLIIQTSFPGDTILTTPLIAELGMRGPVDVVVTPAAAPLLENNPSVRHLFLYDKRGDQRGMGGLWRTARELRGRRLPAADGGGPTITSWRRGSRRARRTAYLAQGSVRSAVLALLAGCEERVGFSTSAGRALYTRCVLFRDDRHHAERLWRLAFPYSPQVEPPKGALAPKLYPGVAEVRAVDQLLRRHDVRDRFVAIAPGSVWGTKRWPYYRELAARLTDHCRVVVVGAHADAETASAIAAACGPARVINTAGTLSLLGSAELLGRASLLVTNDSAPQHLASAMGTPTITIFGPTVPDFGYGPLAPRSKTAGHSALACRPCHHHGPPRCPLEHWRCMRELDVDRVASLVTSILD